MSIALVDSHCHLDHLDLEVCGGDLDAVMHTARDNGVSHMLCVGIDMDTLPRVKAIAADYAHVYASAGVHPNHDAGEPGPSVEELLAAADDVNVVAIGETGLDYFRSEGEQDWQQERFRRHIRAARACGKPLIVHSREAPADSIRILAEEGADRVGGVMHCFVDDWQTAEAAMELGFYISLSGIVTFKSARQLQEVARRLPLDRMLVETDSPWLAPVPFRGKSNQPAYVRHVAEQVAALRGTTLEAVAEATTSNFFRLFNQAEAGTAQV